MEKEKPIGVFDSGVGGLTVVKRISSVMPHESIVYFGDTARVPYGSKSNETVIEYTMQAARFLMQKNIKALVVACNTASAVALDVLKKTFTVPIIGMIEPGAKMAIKTTKNHKIGIAGTRATVGNKAYSKQLLALNPLVEVYEQACPLFVPLAEEGWHKHPSALIIAQEYLHDLQMKDIDTLVLGCTHYPILIDVIRKVMGSHVQLIDSGIAASEVVRAELERIGLVSNSNAMGRMDFFVSDIPSTFKNIAQLFLEREVPHVTKIDTEYLSSLPR
ncbi:MAG: glutamate racemase [Ignavibacteria bacterium]|nr:glutamate racemase [Ignavibacteria bacterium]